MIYYNMLNIYREFLSNVELNKAGGRKALFVVIVNLSLQA